MIDLFDAPVLPGLASRHDLVSDTEKRVLIAAIDGTDRTPFRFQGWEGKRLTTSFGWNYDFDTQKAARAGPMPDWLLPIREPMAEIAGIDSELLIRALLIWNLRAMSCASWSASRRLDRRSGRRGRRLRPLEVRQTGSLTR